MSRTRAPDVGSSVTVSSTKTYYAVFKPKVYECTIRYDGIVVQTATMQYGADIIPPSDPVKEDAQYTYEFVGWQGYTPGMKVTAPAEFNALRATSER